MTDFKKIEMKKEEIRRRLDVETSVPGKHLELSELVYKLSKEAFEKVFYELRYILYSNEDNSDMQVLHDSDQGISEKVNCVLLNRASELLTDEIEALALHWSK